MPRAGRTPGTGWRGGKRMGDGRGSADKRCSALAPAPTSPAARSCPRPGPCERRSRSHTCANIRPPARKTAPLCPAWHRCPSLAVSCGPGLAIVPAGPAPPPPSSWAGDSHSQRWRPCSCPGGWSGRGSSYAVLLARPGRAAQEARPGRGLQSQLATAPDGGCPAPSSAWLRGPHGERARPCHAPWLPVQGGQTRVCLPGGTAWQGEACRPGHCPPPRCVHARPAPLAGCVGQT